jgi:hypothetical protein
MSIEEKKEVTDPQVDASDGGGRSPASGGVAEFLQAPRKKQQNYVVFAISGGFRSEIRDEVLTYLQSLSKTLVLVQPKTPEELARQVSRQIHFLLIDDSFAERSKLLKLVRFMKEKRSAAGMPVMFFTRDPAGLTADYRQELMAHQEVDDFISLKGANPVEVVARIKQFIEARNRRRSRRFKAALPVMYQVLGATKWSPCQLVDISLHGAQIANAPQDALFHEKAQIRIQIPVAPWIGSADGELLHLSARVRRVSVGGEMAGLGFEHLNSRQLLALTKFVTALAASQNTSRQIDNTVVRSIE